MDFAMFEQRLAKLTPREELAIDALVEEYAKDVAVLQAQILQMSVGESEQAIRVRAVTGQLGATIVQAQLKAASTQLPAPDAGLLSRILKCVLAAESAVTGRLKASLYDARPLPRQPGTEFMEEVPPPGRICDEAYVRLRRILNPEPYLQHLMEARHFQTLPEQERNVEINSWLRTAVFTKFLDDVDDEEN